MGKRGGIRVIDPGSRRSSMLSLGVPDLESAKGRVGMAQADLRTALPADAGAAIAAVQERIPDGRVTLDSIHLVRRHGRRVVVNPFSGGVVGFPREYVLPGRARNRRRSPA